MRRILALERVAIEAKGELSARAAAKRSPGRGTHASLFGADDAARALSAADEALGRVIAKVGPLGLKVEALESPFQALARSIVYQQLHGKAAAAILKRVHDAHGGKRTFTPATLLETDEALLRGAGLSRSKMAALQDLARKTLDGTVPTARALARASDEEIIERLITIRGIGRWTVEMLLIFRLGRPDVLPVDDFGVRKGMQRMLGAKELPSRAELAARGERWRPYRSAASWYLWRANDLPVA